jgi:hypothetical protein
MIEVSDLILIALLSGIGAGIGNPIGQAIYKKWVEPHGRKVDNILKDINGFYAGQNKSKKQD